MTTNHGYNTPEQGATDWHIPLNENFEAIDTDTEVRDVSDNLSNYTPKDRAKFLAVDTGEVYVGDGSSWNYLGDIVPEQVSDGSGDGSAFIDVRDFGADPAANDNTQAIRDAIAEAERSGVRSVLIPEFYEVNPNERTVFEIGSNMEIWGLGASSGIYNSQQWDSVDNYTGTFRLDNGAENVHIHDLFFRGTQTDGNTSAEGFSGAHILHSNDNSNQNLQVSNVWALDGRGFIGFKGRGGLNVQNCVVMNHSHCITPVGATDVNISNVVHKRWPVGDRSGWCYRTLFIDGCNRVNVSNVTADGIGDAVAGGTALNLSAEWGPSTSPTEVNVSNCAFKAREGNDAAKGILIQSAGTDMRNVNISNVQCEGFETPIVFWSKTGHASVRDVTFENVTGNPHGAAIHAKKPGAVTDVTFRNCRIEGAPIQIDPPNDGQFDNWTFDGGRYVAPSGTHYIGSSSVGDFTFDGVELDSGASTTLDVRGGPHGRFQFINCDVSGGSLDVTGVERLEILMGRYPSVAVDSTVTDGWIRNAQMLDGGLTNGGGLTADNVDGI